MLSCRRKEARVVLEAEIEQRIECPFAAGDDRERGCTESRTVIDPAARRASSESCMSFERLRIQLETLRCQKEWLETS